MLDPQIQKLVDLYYQIQVPPFSLELPIDQVRALMTQYSNNPLVQLQKDHSLIKEFLVFTSIKEVKLRAYYPRESEEGAPLVFLRGSGFIIPNLEDSDEFCLKLAEKTKRLVLSIDYPLAPEYSFEQSLSATMQVYQWIIEHAEFSRVGAEELVIIGESSGANLACLLINEFNQINAPMCSKLFLLYPILDYRLNLDSCKRYSAGYILSLDKLKYYFHHYSAHLKNPENAFALYKDVSSFPETKIISAEFDPLSDQARVLEKRLKEANVSCTHECYSGMIHGFLKFKDIKAVDALFDKLVYHLKTDKKTTMQ